MVKLVEDDGLGACSLQFDALVKNFLHVGFAARRGDDFFGHRAQPVEALLRHSLRQDGDRGAGQQARNVSTTAAIVAGAGPNRFLGCRVETAGHQFGQQARNSRTDLVRTGREPLANDTDNARLGASDGRGQFDEIDTAKLATLVGRFVVPVDAKQVAHMHIPQADVRQFLFDGIGNERRVAHLCIGGQQDAIVAAALDVLFALGGVDIQVNHGVSPLCFKWSIRGPVRPP